MEGRQQGATISISLAAGAVLIAEGVVYATGSQQATDMLLLAGIVLAVVAFILSRSIERIGIGVVGRIAVGAVVLGGILQVIALAGTIAVRAELGWLHGIGFGLMGLGFIAYGIVGVVRSVIPMALALIFIAMPVIPLVLGDLVKSFTKVEGATLLWGLLWVAVAVLMTRRSVLPSTVSPPES